MTTKTRREALALSAAALSSALFAPRVGRAAAPRRMRLAHNNTTTSSLHVTATAFQRKLADLTGGSLTVDIFPSAQLGSDSEIVKGVSEGTLDMTVSGLTITGLVFPPFSLSEIPYLFADVASARRAFDGAYGRFLADGARAGGLEVIGFAESGLRHVTSNRPVRRPEDLAGLKIRVQPSKVQTEAFTAFGAAPHSLAFSELAEALKTGRVEAQENPIGLIAVNEFIQKLQSHVSLTGHIYSGFTLAISADVMQELSPDHQAAVREAGRSAVQASRDHADASDAANLAKIRTTGMTVVTDVDREAFRRLASRIDQRLEPSYGKEEIARVRALTAA